MSDLFRRNLEVKKNAYLNWGRSDYPNTEFFHHSKMFKESGDLLLAQIGEHRVKTADTVIQPTIYLYRHSIELLLKGIIISEYLMKDVAINDIKKKIKGHDLEALWLKAQDIIKKYLKKDIKNEPSKLEEIDQALLALHYFDEDSTQFRYPYNLKLEKQMIGDGEISYAIDYNHFEKEFHKLYVFLNGCYDIIENFYHEQEIKKIF